MNASVHLQPTLENVLNLKCLNSISYNGGAEMCFVYVCHMCVYFGNACSLVCSPEVGSGSALFVGGQCFAGLCPPLGR